MGFPNFDLGNNLFNLSGIFWPILANPGKLIKSRGLVSRFYKTKALFNKILLIS